jgi:mannose-6-phosphate isomerase-like protein (cupin superfamily)
MSILLTARFAAAQATPGSAEIITAARLRSIADSLPPAASRTAQLGRGDGYTYALTKRDSSGGTESHAAWTDVFVIQTGAGALLSGGTADGAKETTPGEWRGGTIRGGTQRPLRPGDIVVIPAGVPHQMLLERGQQIAYIAFKVAATATKSGR